MINQAYISILYGTAKLFISKMQSLRLDAFRDRNPVGLLALMEVDYLESLLVEIRRILHSKHLFSGSYGSDHEMVIICREVKESIDEAANPLVAAIRKKADSLGAANIEHNLMTVKKALELSLQDETHKGLFFGTVFSSELLALETGLRRVNVLLAKLEQENPNLIDVEQHLDFGWEPEDVESAFARK